MIIETKRLILREYNYDDYDNLLEIVSDPETMQYYPKPYDERGARKWLVWNITNYYKYGFSLWAIILKESNEFIGDCGLTLQTIDGEKLPEIGYHINKRHWRKGYAKEAARDVRDWAFLNTDYQELFSYMNKKNVPSFSTAASIGMRKVKEYNDGEEDLLVYSIKKEEWLNLKKRKETYKNVYFINGNAYAGKSTMAKLLAERLDGIHCEENYQDRLIDSLDKLEFPALTYTRDLKDFRHFIRRTPDEYERWISESKRECIIIEFKILDELVKENKPIFVDTNITPEILHEISDEDHVLIMLTDPMISVTRFFERPDREKQFLYKLLLEENNPEEAMNNFRECLKRINNERTYNDFFNCGFNVLLRDDTRTIDETFELVKKYFKL